MTVPRFAVLLALCLYVDLFGYPPSLDELAELTGLHRNTVDFHLNQLEAAGYVTSTSGSRTTIPTRAGVAVMPTANASERTAPRAVTA